MEIVVVGSVNMDLVMRTGRLPRPGETLIGKDFHLFPGGKGANQAVAAARLESRVMMVGRVGKDIFGESLRQELIEAGVDVTFLYNDTEAPTGTAAIWVDETGQNSIVVASGANMRVVSEDVHKAAQAIQRADLLVCQLEIPPAATLAAIGIARKAGVKVLLNAAPADLSCLDWLDQVDWLVVNESEAEALSCLPADQPDRALAAARSLRQQGAKTIILTMGSLGAWWVGDEEEFFPAFSVQAVDTTAAGDAFVGGLSVSLAGEVDWRQAMRFASAAGALAATRLGAQNSLPQLKEVEELLCKLT